MLEKPPVLGPLPEKEEGSYFRNSHSVSFALWGSRGTERHGVGGARGFRSYLEIRSTGS